MSNILVCYVCKSDDWDDIYACNHRSHDICFHAKCVIKYNNNNNINWDIPSQSTALTWICPLHQNNRKRKWKDTMESNHHSYKKRKLNDDQSKTPSKCLNEGIERMDINKKGSKLKRILNEQEFLNELNHICDVLHNVRINGIQIAFVNKGHLWNKNYEKYLLKYNDSILNPHHYYVYYSSFV